MPGGLPAIDFWIPGTNHGSCGDSLNFVNEIQSELMSRPGSNTGRDIFNGY